jgi:hypothetical protein
VLISALAMLLASASANEVREHHCAVGPRREPEAVVGLARTHLEGMSVKLEGRKLLAVSFVCLGERPVWRVRYSCISPLRCCDCTAEVYVGDRDGDIAYISQG